MGWLCSYCLAWWLCSHWVVYYCCPEAKCKMCWFKTVVRHGSCVKFNFKSLTPKRSMSQQTGCTRYSFVQLDPVERVLGFNACQRSLRDMYDYFFKLSVLFWRVIETTWIYTPNAHLQISKCAWLTEWSNYLNWLHYITFSVI